MRNSKFSLWWWRTTGFSLWWLKLERFLLTNYSYKSKLLFNVLQVKFLYETLFVCTRVYKCVDRHHPEFCKLIGGGIHADAYTYSNSKEIDWWTNQCFYFVNSRMPRHDQKVSQTASFGATRARGLGEPCVDDNSFGPTPRGVPLNFSLAIPLLVTCSLSILLGKCSTTCRPSWGRAFRIIRQCC